MKKKIGKGGIEISSGVEEIKKVMPGRMAKHDGVKVTIESPIPLHKRERSEAMNSDEYETEDELFEDLTKKYRVNPTLDVCATKENTKCAKFFSKETDALKQEWTEDWWMNPFHNKTRINGKMISGTEVMIRKGFEQWQKHNKNGMCIIPANAMCTKFAKECIEGHAEYHPIFKRPRFLVGGKPSKDSARNGYFVVIYRSRDPPCICSGFGCPACK